MHRDFLLATSLPPKASCILDGTKPEYLVLHRLLVSFKGGLTSPMRLLIEHKPGLKWGGCDEAWSSVLLEAFSPAA